MMTRKKYIKKVAKKLRLPMERKAVILGDLEELFDSAQEHGENELDVIHRIGDPDVFVNDVIQNMDLSEKQKKYIKRSHSILILISLFTLLAVLFTGYFITWTGGMDHVIGHADSATNIQVVGGLGNILPILFCALLWLSSIVLIVYLCYMKKQMKK